MRGPSASSGQAKCQRSPEWLVHSFVWLAERGRALEGLDAVAQGVGICCPKAHGNDGSSSPESDDGIGVFHEVGEDLEAAQREALEFFGGCVRLP